MKSRRIAGWELGPDCCQPRAALPRNQPALTGGEGGAWEVETVQANRHHRGSVGHPPIPIALQRPTRAIYPKQKYTWPCEAASSSGFIPSALKRSWGTSASLIRNDSADAAPSYPKKKLNTGNKRKGGRVTQKIHPQSCESRCTYPLNTKPTIARHTTIAPEPPSGWRASLPCSPPR